MRALAIETSGMSGSVAAFDEGRLLAELALPPTRRTAQTLAPTLQNLLRQLGWQPHEVNLVVVTQGPGSFTGLRIGVTTAKTFSYATGAALLGVNTLAAIAQQVTVSDGLLWVIMNAEREQLFVALFCRQGAEWLEIEPVAIVNIQTWLGRLENGAIVCGPGLKGLLERLPSGVRVSAESAWTPQAASVGRVGIRSFLAGQRSDCWSLLPNYFRESAAVEKAAVEKVRASSGTANHPNR